MNTPKLHSVTRTLAAVAICFSISGFAQAPNNPPRQEGAPPPPPSGRPGDVLVGPGPGGPGGPGRGGFGGVQPDMKVVEKFDKDGDKRLNADERKAAREFLQKERAEGRGPRGFGGGRGGRGGGRGFGGEAPEPTKPGPKISPADVKNFPDAPLYDLPAFRTFFLEFEEADWEKELAEFKNTDVEVPAKVTVDGKTYKDVGVHFRGMSSFGMIGEGRKRSFNLSFDFADEKQNIYGYRTLNFLNANDDPTFLRSILYNLISREYMPAPKANWVRVVVNGESWGVYMNVQQFNRDFIKDWFGTTKGTRWKAPGSPGGRANLAYLGDDVAEYKRVFEIKTKDDKKAWKDLINLTKVLNETPTEQLEKALEPIFDIDGALKFLAIENTLINNDGYWVRTSDYSIYQDEKGRFHILTHDFNETFMRPGGPGMGGGPGMMLAPAMMSQGDKNADQKLDKEEMAGLAGAWFDKLDKDKAGKLNQEQFADRFSEILPPPQGFGPPGGPPGGGPGGSGPGRFVGPGFFTATDSDKDGSVTRAEFKASFEKWAEAWDTKKSGSLNDEALRAGLAAALPQPNFGGPGGGRGGPEGPGGGGRGFGGGPRINGVELDPLQMASDQNKPLISKLLAVPALRERYLGYVKDIAEKWLDWNKLGPIAEKYHAMIAEEVKADTRKLYSTEAFEKGLTQTVGGRGTIGLKEFADQRRKYLLEHAEVKKATVKQ